MSRKQKKGFTLLEILLVIAAIGILAAIVLIAINPNRQIEAARTAQRKSDINSIAKAVQQFIIDNAGVYPGGMASMSTNGSRVVCKTGTETTGGATDCTGYADLRALVPTYMAGIPTPNTGDYIVTRTTNGASASYDSSNIWAIAGSIRPTLDLNFARDKQLTNTVTGTNPISFTRESTGTYVGSDGLIKTAIANDPRFDHNPVTKESLGLLVEEQRINRFQNSTASGACSITSGTTIGPDGAIMNKAVIGSGSVSFPSIGSGATEAFTLSTGQTRDVTISGWFAAGNTGMIIEPRLVIDFRTSPNTNYTYAELQINTSNWTIRSKLIGSDISEVFAPSITQYGGGYRVTWTVRYTQGLTVRDATAGYIQLRDVNQSGTFTGDGVGHFQYYGVQVETGGNVTSYIPTTTGPITRATDATNITGTNFNAFYTQGPGSLYTEAYTTLGVDQQYMGISTTGFAFRLRKNGSNQYHLVARDGVTRDITQTPIPALTNNQLIKIAATYNTNDMALSGGGQSTTTGSTIALGTYDRLDIGTYAGGGAVCASCTIRRVTYWPIRLSNTVLSDISR